MKFLTMIFLSIFMSCIQGVSNNSRDDSTDNYSIESLSKSGISQSVSASGGVCYFEDNNGGPSKCIQSDSMSDSLCEMIQNDENGIGYEYDASLENCSQTYGTPFSAGLCTIKNFGLRVYGSDEEQETELCSNLGGIFTEN